MKTVHQPLEKFSEIQTTHTLLLPTQLVARWQNCLSISVDVQLVKLC